MDAVEARLEKRGIILPEAQAPAANYVPFLLRGTTLYISVQLPTRDGKLLGEGLLGMDSENDIIDGKIAAMHAALNVLAQAKAALGNLERIKTCLRLGGYVACTHEFTDHAQVMNGASDVMADALGEAGRHTRIAVGVVILPLGALVEVDALFDVSDEA